MTNKYVKSHILIVPEISFINENIVKKESQKSDSLQVKPIKTTTKVQTKKANLVS